MLISIRYTAKSSTDLPNDRVWSYRNPTEYEAERGLTDSSERGTPTLVYKLIKRCHSGAQSGGSGGGQKQNKKGKESDTPLFLLYLSTSLHRGGRYERACWSKETQKPVLEC